MWLPIEDRSPYAIHVQFFVLCQGALVGGTGVENDLPQLIISEKS